MDSVRVAETQRQLIEFYETVWQIGIQMATVAGTEAHTAAFRHMVRFSAGLE